MNWRYQTFFPLNEQERKQLRDSAELVNVWESLPEAFAQLRAEFAELKDAHSALRAEHEELKQAVLQQLSPRKPEQKAAVPGDVIRFSGYDWYIVKIGAGMMTLLCRQCVTMMPYREALQWLNTDFYASFPANEKKQICEVLWPDFRMFVHLLKRKDAERLPADILACGSWWWLLSETGMSGMPVVFSDGGIGIIGADQSYASYGVRPVIMVKI